MAKFAKSKNANMIVYGILGLLVLSLGGFGITNFGGSIRSVASVGDREVGVSDYARALQNDLSQMSQQFGQQITLAQARSFGRDTVVLQQLLAGAAIDNEVARLGFSVGDETVREQIVQIPAFQGINGGFDKVNYEQRLRSNGISTKDFEQGLREQTSRSFLQGAVGGGIVSNPAYGDTIVSFLTEERSFEWAVIDATALDSAPEPTAADLQSYYDANPASYTLPEAREITYAILLPDVLADSTEVSDEDIQKLYDERASEFQQPERRLIERLVFADDATAAAAKARLDSGDVRFTDLLTERGLTLSEVDMGDVARTSLSEATAEVLFADGFLGVAGPLPSDLGPAIYRVNGVLAALNTPLEEVRDDLRYELAISGARRAILDEISPIDDLLAGGASLEEIAAETSLVLEKTSLSADSAEGIAAYDEFREAALAAQSGDFPEVVELSDGGIFALRLDSITPPTLQPLADVKDAVRADWVDVETQRLLNEMADEKIALLAGDGSFADQGLTATAAVGLRRDASVAGTPPTTVFEAFNLSVGALAKLDGVGEVYVLRLNEIKKASATGDDANIGELVANEVNRSLSNDIYNAFTDAIRAEAGVSINPTAVNAVLTQLATNGN